MERTFINNTFEQLSTVVKVYTLLCLTRVHSYFLISYLGIQVVNLLPPIQLVLISKKVAYIAILLHP